MPRYTKDVEQAKFEMCYFRDRPVPSAKLLSDIPRYKDLNSGFSFWSKQNFLKVLNIQIRSSIGSISNDRCETCHDLDLVRDIR